MSVLIVVAHPDDEVLGCGGTAAALSGQGIEVYTCILSGDAGARQNRPALSELSANIHEANSYLGIKDVMLGSFPNIEFNTVPHLRMVQFIEDAIIRVAADVIITHHPSDLNNDHYQTSIACQAAARLFQRREDIKSLISLHFMEILSSTDWAFPYNNEIFSPNSFVEISEEFLIKKVNALSIYKGVLRDSPHPRSREIIHGLAAFRGGQCGVKYAEAFQTVFQCRRILKD